MSSSSYYRTSDVTIEHMLLNILAIKFQFQVYKPDGILVI
jgi:hypothetical protein